MMAKLIRFLVGQRMVPLYDQLIVSGSSFATIVLVGRQLPPEQFGFFNLGLMSMLFLANLHRAVFTQPMNVLGASDDAAQLAGRWLALLRAHMVAIPVSVASLMVISSLFFPQVSLLLAVSIYVTGYFLQEMIRRYWYTLGRTGDALRNDLVSYGGQVMLLLAFSAIWPLSGAIAFSIMAFTSVVAFFYGLTCLNLPKAIRPKNQRAVFSDQWALSSWLVLTVLAVWGAGQAYPFLITPLGPIAVASFSACRTLLNVMGIFVQSISNVLPARASALLQKEGKTALFRHIQGTLGRAALASVVFLFAIHFFAAKVMHVVFDGRYDSAAYLLQILAWGTVATLIATVMGSYALAMGDSRSGFIANLGASIMTFTLGIWLIKRFGVTGAAIATAASLATAMLLQAGLVSYRYSRMSNEVPLNA